MSKFSGSNTLITIIFFFILFYSVPQVRPENHLPVRAVNLGGWLVAESWITPSILDGLPNKDILDGTSLHFKSIKFGSYLSADSGGGYLILANIRNASDWETFRLWRLSATNFYFRVWNDQFVGLNKANNSLVAVQNTPSSLETFMILRKSDDLNRVRIQASNGLFLQVKTEQLVSADFQGNATWEDDDPSVFLMEIKELIRMGGDYQIANAYGPQKATQVMQEHWRTFIVEDDFRFVARNSLNAVRIPVGWWIAYPNPPKPYVAGSLQFLDNAFLWAERYGLKVIIDMHCAPGSQNRWVGRDGSHYWGTNDTIQKTVDVIEFLTARYAKSPSLLAVGLLNEPSPDVSVETLTKYYKASYEVVRKHSSNAYVMLSNRVEANPKEPFNHTQFFDLARHFSNSVIDVHFYNLYQDKFYEFTVEQNLEYVRNDRSAELAGITKSNDPLIFIGEWAAAWGVINASKRDYQNFAAIQLKVYEQATFGWAYWCLKSAKKHWNLEWMIKNGYIEL